MGLTREHADLLKKLARAFSEIDTQLTEKEAIISSLRLEIHSVTDESENRANTINDLNARVADLEAENERLCMADGVMAERAGRLTEIEAVLTPEVIATIVALRPRVEEVLADGPQAPDPQ